MVFRSVLLSTADGSVPSDGSRTEVIDVGRLWRVDSRLEDTTSGSLFMKLSLSPVIAPLNELDIMPTLSSDSFSGFIYGELAPSCFDRSATGVDEVGFLDSIAVKADDVAGVLDSYILFLYLNIAPKRKCIELSRYKPTLDTEINLQIESASFPSWKLSA